VTVGGYGATVEDVRGESIRIDVETPDRRHASLVGSRV